MLGGPMLIACWSSKGGSGVTVVASALAVQASRSSPESESVLLVDLAEDIPATLGLKDSAGPGLAGWFAAGDHVGVDALSALSIEAAPSLEVLPGGRWTTASAHPQIMRNADRLARSWAQSDQLIIADVGTGPKGGTALDACRAAVLGAATQRLLIVRPCYIALRRALDGEPRPSAVVLVREPGRSLDSVDIEQAMGVNVMASIDFDPAIARAVDAGLLSARLPRSIDRALRPLLRPAKAAA